jgi:hypothetical protein
LEGRGCSQVAEERYYRGGKEVGKTITNEPEGGVAPAPHPTPFQQLNPASIY